MAFRWIGKSTDGNTVTLNKLESGQVLLAPYSSTSWIEQNADIVRRGLVLDVETTGLNHSEDTIIEIAIRSFLFNKQNGDVLKIEEAYTSFQDPGRPIKPEISELTGITDEMVKNQSIDWEKVGTLFESSHIIIAHNARFDRPFIDQRCKISQDKIWGCSLKQINWSAKGFFSSKLELLNIYHGFFVDAHRALNDVDALLYLLSLNSSEFSNESYLNELLQNARRNTTQIIATGTRFETKDLLKARGYNWDNTNKFWHRFVYKEEAKAEILWLEENIYHGPFAGFTREIPLQDQFKAGS